MIQINLLPPELRKKESPKIMLPEIPIKKTLVVAVGFILVVQVLVSLAAGVLAFQSGATKAAIEKLSGEVAETRRIKEASVGALNKLKDIRALTTKKFYWASLLNAITDSVSKGVWLRTLSLDETVVEVPKPNAKKNDKGIIKKSDMIQQRSLTLKLDGSVYAAGQETAFIGKFVKSLKENSFFNDLFSQIDLSNISQRKINEYDVYDFTLFCRFKKEKI